MPKKGQRPNRLNSRFWGGTGCVFSGGTGECGYRITFGLTPGG